MAAAVKSMPSPSSGLMSAFSPYTDSPGSPSYPTNNNKRSSSDSQGHLQPGPQKSPQQQLFSPSSDIADPSPIASSNGTDTTDIDETAIEEDRSRPVSGSDKVSIKVATKDEDGNDFKPAADDDQPASVIHAPGGYQTFHASQTSPEIGRVTPTPSSKSDLTIISPSEEDIRKSLKNSPISPPPITTSVPQIKDTYATPRAQTLQEAEIMEKERAARARSSTLEDIPESTDLETDDDAEEGSDKTAERIDKFATGPDEVPALRLALQECWTLCNTLAGLSHVHRERSFRRPAARGDGRGQAWKACWKLCQTLYDTWDAGAPAQVAPTLGLCRDFCQSLFEVRQRADDRADSVLRVSFELNNHLYNTHDRALPEAFRERTLDFYITLCHRLMKQRAGLVEESDALLRACWGLAEMLFSLRQHQREGRAADEELLGSAVQSCWELCDLFREGWTQVRPDRGTPRPAQTTFAQAAAQAGSLSDRDPVASGSIVTLSDVASLEDFELDRGADFGRAHPETPTTIFEDTQQLSPDEGSVPNIVVLGPEANEHYARGWASSSSSLSSWSDGGPPAGVMTNGAGGGPPSEPDARTGSSSGTVTRNANTPVPGAINGTGAGGSDPSSPEDPRLTCLHLLILRAATNLGYDPAASSSNGSVSGGSSSSVALPAFVKSLPSGSFGAAPWQVHLLEQYKKLVTADPSFRGARGGRGPPRRAMAPDVARSVRWMTHSGQYAWLHDLFRWVFGFRVEEAALRPGVDIQV